MIPIFPEFKKLDLGDREAVESHTRRYSPYSDFNFTSLWAWDTNNERMISELNENLVVRFTDYKTHEPFLSFLGSNETEHTAQALLEYCKEHSLPETLKLVPEVSTVGIRPSVLRIEEDRDNFDYVYSVHELSTLNGKKYEAKRHRANKFARENPEARIEIIDLANATAHENMTALLQLWERNKLDSEKEYEIEKEFAAITRLFESVRSHDVIVIGVFNRTTMIGFMILETLPDQYAIGHFLKCDSTYAGIYEFITQKSNMHLGALDIQFFNHEQDLGVQGLRRSKMAYRPANFLKKHTISFTG